MLDQLNAKHHLSHQQPTADPIQLGRRTIHTSMTLMLVVLAMMFVGGDGLKWFSIAMFVGIFVGTYSSIYIGTAFALWRGLNRHDFIVQVKPEFAEEEVHQNDIPK